MRNLTFKYAAAWNFLPFGPEGIELRFDKYKNIILVRGENRDAKPIDSDQSDEYKISSNGTGKCFRKNTPILMFDGTIRYVQDVRIGDLVMGPDSKPRLVLSLGRGREAMYEIKPKKGNSYFVNESHVLTLKRMYSKEVKGIPSVWNVTVRDYFKQPEWKRKLYGTYRTGVSYPPAPVPIDPYVLGAWLGDGTNSKPEITTADREIFDAFSNEGFARGLRVSTRLIAGNAACKVLMGKNGKKCTKMAFDARMLRDQGLSCKEAAGTLSTLTKKEVRTSSVYRWYKSENLPLCENTFLQDLKSLGLTKGEKFVPAQYKSNDKTTRLAILAGLLDTDGSSDGCGYDFTNKSKQLADDVAYLARSLGMAANVKICSKTCGNNGVVGVYYRVSIYGDNCSEIPVRLTRKKVAARKINKDCLKTAIEVIPLNKEDYYGFAVDGDHLFLLGDFTVVHNSSLPEIVVYALFGKTIKRPEKLGVNDVVHNKIGKDCKVELWFDDYRIVRTRKEGGKEKHALRLWKSDTGAWDDATEITQGTMATTQKEIEKVIGLSYDAFMNMCIFTDDQRACFLESDNTKKKEIVENLLSLGVYREWFENAKALRKEVKTKIDGKAKEFQLMLGNRDDAKRRLTLTQEKDAKWKIDRKAEYELLVKKVAATVKALGETDTGAALLAYEAAQAKIKELNEKIPTVEASKEELAKNLTAAKNKEAEQKAEAQKLTKLYEEFSSTAKSKLAERKAKEAEIADLKSEKPGTRCGKCKGRVEIENINSYVEGLQLEINNINIDIKKDMASGTEIAAKTEDLKKRQAKVTAYIDQFSKKIAEKDGELRTFRNEIVAASQVREPKADAAESLLQQQIETLKEQQEAKKKELAGPSPFVEILDNDKVELKKVEANVAKKEEEIKTLEAELPYYDYWIVGFGDKGIRKWVVDGIIPELNSRVNYWLQFLIDNKITLKFDNELNETIQRNPVDGDPYIYHAMSTGQRRRLNLSVSQSFSHITSISTGAAPSFVFLDEVTTNIDIFGTLGIYNMIQELATDKQVFVTTHDQEMLKLLDGCDVIDLVHENGITRLKQNES